MTRDFLDDLYLLKSFEILQNNCIIDSYSRCIISSF